MLKSSIYFFVILLLVGCSKFNEVINPKPVAEFSYQVGDFGVVSFSNKSLNSDSQKWDFGNGKTSIIENPSTVYQKNGQYIVSLTVTGKGGQAVTTKTVPIVNIKGSITVYNASFQNNKNIDVYVDGNFLGTISGKTYYTNNPGCFANSTVFGDFSEGQHTITAKEQGGTKTWSTKVNVESGGCFVQGLG